jgi:hypothetical protein
MSSWVSTRQRAQNAWKDDQPIRVVVHKPARLRYGRVTVKEGDYTAAKERRPGMQAKPANQSDC